MEQTHNTTEKILAAIEIKQVTPRPKWYFVTRNILLWVPGLATTFLGAYAVSGVLYGVLHAHLENRLYTTSSGQIASLIAIPVLWIISFAIFSIITISFLRKTSSGYRHPAAQLLSISVAGSVVIGILFYTFTSASLAGPGMLYRYPTQHQQQAIWNAPDQGRISGVVATINGNAATLADFHGHSWTVDITAVPADDQKFIKIGDAIRIVGVETGEHAFEACRVLPWELLPIENDASQPSLNAHPATISCDSILLQFRQ